MNLSETGGHYSLSGAVTRKNRYIESFKGKLWDELSNGEIFIKLFEAKVLIENWRHQYNQTRSHSALDYRPPAPEAIKAQLKYEAREIQETYFLKTAPTQSVITQ